MALTFYFTGGGSASSVLGGLISSTALTETSGAIFPAVPLPDAMFGITNYACIAMKNTGTTTIANAGIYISSAFEGSDTYIAQGLTGKSSTTEQTLAKNTTEPIDTLAVGAFSLYRSYTISAMGTTTNAQWNTIAGTVSDVRTVGAFSPGLVYCISNRGTTTTAQWNTIAGTTGITYDIGSTFTCVASGAGFGTGTADYPGYQIGSFFTCANVGTSMGTGQATIASSLIFQQPKHAYSVLSIGALTAGQFQHFWLKRVVHPNQIGSPKDYIILTGTIV